MTRTCAPALAAALLVSTASAAQGVAPGSPGHWSVATGETVSTHADAFRFDVGWPGVGFTYLHGLSDRSDIGARFDLLYGWEQTDHSKFGFGFGVPFRLVLNRKEKITLGVHIDPGIAVYTGNNYTGNTDFFLRFPVGGILAVQVNNQFRLAGTIDVTLAGQLLHTAFFEAGPQFGVAGEYSVDRNLNVALQMRFGPQFYSVSGSNTDLAFYTAVVIGYRL